MRKKLQRTIFLILLFGFGLNSRAMSPSHAMSSGWVIEILENHGLAGTDIGEFIDLSSFDPAYFQCYISVFARELNLKYKDQKNLLVYDKENFDAMSQEDMLQIKRDASISAKQLGVQSKLGRKLQALGDSIDQKIEDVV